VDQLEKVRLGLIGCGAISRKYGEIAKTATDFGIVAVADTNPEAAQRFVGAYCADRGQVSTYPDYRALLEDPDVDAVVVATPSGLHASIGYDALDAGKHCLIEKPLALSVRDASRLTEKAEAERKCLGTVHPNREYPTSRMAYDAVHQGSLGILSHAVAVLRWNRPQRYYDEAPWRKTRVMDGGVLFNQAWHVLDLLLWFMGPVESVTAMAAKRLHQIEIDDVVLLALKFGCGALGSVEATTNVYPSNLEESISVFGSTGTVVLGGARTDAIKLWRVAGADESEILALWSAETAPRHGTSWAHRRVFGRFLQGIAGGARVLPEVRDAVQVVGVAENAAALPQPEGEA
jgi:predicted dehydrogenase